jgi:uncharacterized protein (TIGR02757 family)
VQQVTRFLEDLFGRMGKSPYAYIRQGDFSALSDAYYRLHKGSEIIALCEILKNAVERFGSVGRMLAHYYDGSFREALWNARKDLIRGNEFLFFFPKENTASPVKRWSLYARWMVRRDDIDFGLWDFMKAADLVVPLDANVYKIGRCHGWTDQKSQNWKAACQITDVLKEYCPDDPLKYDFFLCHAVGIKAGCTGSRSAACAIRCFLYEV